MVFATLGTFATGGGFSDLLLLYVLGLLGVLMALAKVPVAPAIVGLILGPLFEEQALRAVLLEGGSISGLFSTPLSIVLWLVALLALVVPLGLTVRRSRSARTGGS
jgi:putative tricarboxylic transport membrane protein